MTDNALAQDAAGTAAGVVPNPIDTGDTAWMLVSSALVLLMTPGLAFFYGGLVRSRNVLNTMMMSLVMMGVIGVSSGVSAVVAAWMIGPRKDHLNNPHTPHNVPYVLLGIGLLWFGWFGFNGGSAFGSGSLATVAFLKYSPS